MHAVLDPEGPDPPIRVHSIRGFSASVKFMKSSSVTSVLEAEC